MTAHPTDALFLLPMPRRWSVRTGSGWSRPEGPVRVFRDDGAAAAPPDIAAGFASAPSASDATVVAALRPLDGIDPTSTRGQSYELVVEPDGVRIEAPTSTGIDHALRTLSQVLRQCPRRVPAMAIDDEPSFATRGVMLDISRDRVPTMRHLRAVIDRLASLKINHLQLYTEHTFAYAGHEVVWRDASPMTPAEVREIDAYAAARGVEVAANQNCFGHMHQWMRHAPYAALAETHGDWDFDGFPKHGPFSLCPLDPGALPLVRDLLGQIMPCVRSPLVNIGCDETFDVGQGRSRAAVERDGRGVVYARFVRAVADIVLSSERRPMFWADIALSNPEALDRLDRRMIALAWGYEPDAAFGAWCETLREQGFERWVCPGTSSWRSITGRTSERRANLVAAATQGVAGGATGLLVTDWGDMGHRQTWAISLHGLAEGANAAWNAPSAPTYDPRAGAVLAFEATPEFGVWLDALGDADLAIRRAWALRNATALFVDLHEPLDAPTRAGDDLALWRETHATLRELVASCPSGPDDLAHAADVAEFAAARAVARRTGAADPETIRARRATIIETHRRLWGETSRPDRLSVSAAYYEEP
jgi:hypothetical protein